MKARIRRIVAVALILALFALLFQAGRMTERYLPLISSDPSGPTVPGAKATIPAAAQSGGESLPLSPADRVLGLASIWEAAKVNYPFWHRLPELDWDKAYREYVPRVLSAEDDIAYYHLLEEFIALLQDGHSSVQMPQALARQLNRPDLRLLPVPEGLVVAVVGSSLREQGLVAGALLTAVDGRPVSELLPAAAARMAASTAQDRLEKTAALLLKGPAGSAVDLTFALPDGTSRTFHTTRDMPQGAAPESLSKEDLGDGIFLVTIRNFTDKKIPALFDQAFPSFRGVKGLILDVRENGGGNTPYGDAIIRRLIRTPIRTSGWRTRLRTAAFSAWGRGERWYGMGPGLLWPSGIFGQYSGPVLILTSPRTYSAAEDFVIRLKSSGRARTVGQPTGGGTGQPLLFGLPGGGMARVITKWDYAPDGSEFVGVGIQPDVAVTPTAADYAAGRDPVLAKAVELLQK